MKQKQKQATYFKNGKTIASFTFELTELKRS